MSLPWLEKSESRDQPDHKIRLPPELHRRLPALAAEGILGKSLEDVVVHKALHILFATPAQADRWIKRANMASLFAGASALGRMMAGQVADLYVVRQYLDAQRG